MMVITKRYRKIKESLLPLVFGVRYSKNVDKVKNWGKKKIKLVQCSTPCIDSQNIKFNKKLKS